MSPETIPNNKIAEVVEKERDVLRALKLPTLISAGLSIGSLLLGISYLISSQDKPEVTATGVALAVAYSTAFALAARELKK